METHHIKDITFATAKNKDKAGAEGSSLARASRSIRLMPSYLESGYKRRTNETCASCLIERHEPLAETECSTFRGLLVSITGRPSLPAPDRRTVRRINENEAKETNKDFKSQLREAVGVSPDTNSWISLAGDSYIAVIAHFIDEGEMQL
ncbi:unnamed protein product [Discosporangium mesarthrocarpum]